MYTKKKGYLKIEVSDETYSIIRDLQNKLILKHHKFVTMREISNRIIKEHATDDFDIPDDEIIGRVNYKNYKLNEIKEMK